jgi:hypothetical protein
MSATHAQIAVLIADEDDIDAAIDAAIATMTDAAVLALLSAPHDVPVTLAIPSTSSVIEAAIEAAIAAAIEAEIESASQHPKGVFPASYSDHAWQGAATI